MNWKRKIESSYTTQRNFKSEAHNIFLLTTLFLGDLFTILQYCYTMLISTPAYHDFSLLLIPPPLSSRECSLRLPFHSPAAPPEVAGKHHTYLLSSVSKVDSCSAHHSSYNIVSLLLNNQIPFGKHYYSIQDTTFYSFIEKLGYSQQKALPEKKNAVNT